MKKSLVLSVLIICSIIYGASSQLAFEKDEYAGRRKKLMEMIPDGIAIIRGASEPLGNYHFRQYNNMMYFAGVEIPDVILVIDGANKNSTLFFTIDEPTAEGYNIPLTLVRDPVSTAGIENYLPYKAFSGFLTERLNTGTVIYTPFSSEELPGENSGEKFRKYTQSVTGNEWDGRLSREMQFVKVLEERYPGNKVLNCSPLIWDLRKIKSSAEVDVLRKAARITVEAHKAVMKATRPGVEEMKLAALFQYINMSHGAQGLAFGTIIMSDKNHAFGHYMEYDRTLQEEDFIILDGGAVVEYYSSDVSTTFPANGKFTEKQREVYEFGLLVREICLNNYRPGNSLTDVGAAIEKELVKRGYDINDNRIRSYIRNGGYNHSIGMAVHDRLNNLDREEPLQPGFVFACDIMAKADDVTGIRIEDTVVITEDGCEILSSGLPRTVEEIEAFMKNN
jgi:Xaa-Pro aminopeptidase